MTDPFDQSIVDGIHAQLAPLAGSWRGTARTWFEPDELADESPIQGTIRPVLNGRFLLHEYTGNLVGYAMIGIALYGYNLATRQFEAAWADTCHMGTGILYSTTTAAADTPFSALGHYPDGVGGPPWGWRTDIAQPAPDELIITHYNIPPGGEPAKAVEIHYHRAAD